MDEGEGFPPPPPPLPPSWGVEGRCSGAGEVDPVVPLRPGGRIPCSEGIPL